VLLPTFKLKAPEALPDVTALHDPDPTRARIAALACVAEGVTVIEEVLLPTLVVYDVVPELNVGLSDPEESVSPVSVASLDGARVTVTE
jgi:hypothetical protein